MFPPNYFVGAAIGSPLLKSHHRFAVPPFSKGGKSCPPC